MIPWRDQMRALIAPAVAKSAVTDHLLIDRGATARTGAIAAQVTPSRRALICADEAGFAAAGPAVQASLEGAGFAVTRHILPVDPLPRAATDEAQPFLDALRADGGLFPVSVGSGVINDLTKYAAFQTDTRYLSVATAASMDGYTSAGAPLAKDGFKVTIPTRAPIALIADLDVIAAAPPEMTGWGYGDLAGKAPAGGDWLLAELAGVEARDTVAWPLVQDHLSGWLADPQALSGGDFDACARLFIGLTAVGFAMEFHGSSRPASGADHQIAHLWEMEGHVHRGRKVSHGAAVSVGCVAALSLFDWLLDQDLGALDAPAPDLDAALAEMGAVIADPRIAKRAEAETRAKWPDPGTHADRMARIRDAWPASRDQLRRHLPRADVMAAMLRAAGAPSHAAQIGVTPDHLARTMRAAAFIRSRYTVIDFLKEAGLYDAALTAVLPGLTGDAWQGAAQ